MNIPYELIRHIFDLSGPWWLLGRETCKYLGEILSKRGEDITEFFMHAPTAQLMYARLGRERFNHYFVKRFHRIRSASTPALMALSKYVDKTEMLCGEAAGRGDLELLKALCETGCNWTDSTSDEAAQHGHLDCLQFLSKAPLKHECRWSAHTCSLAAENGHLDCLEFLHESGCEWNAFTTSGAARYGHLDCLKYAHENGCVWYDNTCSGAAMKGHLDCLKYAHENGAPWDYWTCVNAVMGGHLDCLKYAHERGCELTWESRRWSMLINNAEITRYLDEHGCP